MFVPRVTQNGLDILYRKEMLVEYYLKLFYHFNKMSFFCHEKIIVNVLLKKATI